MTGERRVSAVDLSGPLGRATWQVAWPVMFTQALYTMLNVVDMFWVGKLGPAAVAAVALSGSVLGVLFALGQLVTVSAMATAARAAGANDRHGVGASLRHAAMLALALATPLALLGFIFSPQVLGLFRAAPEVLAAGRHYLQLIFLGLPGFMLGMSFYSVFQATGDTRSPMLITLGTNILNLVLDPVLIFGWLGFPRLGVTGAAVATLIAQHLGLFAMAWLLAHRGMLELKGPVRRSMFRSMLGIGVPAGLQGVTRPVTGMAMFAIISGFGTAATAAFGIGLRAFEIMYIYLAGLGSAGEALVGQSLGRNDPGLAVRVTRRVTIIASLLQLVVLPLLFVFAPAVVRAFSADPAVVSAGTGYLRVLTPVLLLLGLSTAWTSAQRGAGATTVPMVAALVSNWLVKLPLAYVLAVMTRAGIIGVWLGIGASVVAETGILGVGYFAGGWKRKEVKWA